MIRAIKGIFLALLLGGCANQNLSPTTIAPICTALIGPIKYTSVTRTSQRFAGPVLVGDLRQHNSVWNSLCKR